MDKHSFHFDLPKRLIAQQPTEARGWSRLMRLNRETGAIFHSRFKDICSFLRPGDCLVINDSRVIPARLMGVSTSGEVEVLLHERLEANQWTALVKPGKRARVGAEISFGEGRLKATVIGLGDEGLRIVSLGHEGELEPLLDEIGEMPLPHYIEEKQEDTSRYQTVYAKHDGSVAAPTAGLHFTEEILEEIARHGVSIVRVTLHVGIGTFRPVKDDDITKHHMHSEYCRIEPAAATVINNTKASGGRVVCIGTTSCRTIESRADTTGQVTPGAGKTDIFIYPGYKFKIMDGLLTNFHLPESTLIMLVAAFFGQDATLRAYEEAVREEYRFFSYGDAMLIL